MTSIVAILKGILELIGIIKDVIALARKAKKEKWIKDGRELAKRIKNAKTNKQRRALVRKLARHKL